MIKRRGAPARPLIDTDEFTRANGELSAQQSPDDFPRLHDLLVDDEGAIEWRLNGERRRRAQGGSEGYLRLTFSGTVNASCVRCLEAVRTDLAEERLIKLALTETQAEREDVDAEDFDVLAANPRLDVLDLVEDELIMELPIAPRHEACSLPDQTGDGVDGAAASDEPVGEPSDAPGTGNAADDPPRPRPFAVLASLKGRTRN